jgi:hypothetical protein
MSKKLPLSSLRIPREGMLVNYSVRFFMEGLDDCLLYNVSKEEQDRIKLNLEKHNPTSLDNMFLCFETLDGVDVVVNANCIEITNLLFEVADTDKITEPKEEPLGEDCNVLIKLITRKEPYTCYVENSESIASFFFSLDGGHFFDSFFDSFIDEDGEEVYFDARKILYIEAESKLIKEGDRIMQEG